MCIPSSITFGHFLPKKSMNLYHVKMALHRTISSLMLLWRQKTWTNYLVMIWDHYWQIYHVQYVLMFRQYHKLYFLINSSECDLLQTMSKIHQYIYGIGLCDRYRRATNIVAPLENHQANMLINRKVCNISNSMWRMFSTEAWNDFTEEEHFL